MISRLALALAVAAASTGATAQTNKQTLQQLLAPHYAKTNPAIPLAEPPPRPEPPTSYAKPTEPSLRLYPEEPFEVAHARMKHECYEKHAFDMLEPPHPFWEARLPRSAKLPLCILKGTDRLITEDQLRRGEPVRSDPPVIR